MPRLKEIIGDKFHRLEVLEFYGFDKYMGKIYRCICECGTIKNIRGHSLIQGKSKSCGCLNSEKSSQRAKLINKKKWEGHLYLTKEEKNAKKCKRRNARYLSDENYRLSERYRGLIRSAIRYNRQSNRYIDILGCTVKDYCKFLESKFLDGMTWENRSIEWEIDHIEPINRFDLTNEYEAKYAFNWSNTQPLWKTDHLKKSALETKEKML